MDLALPKGAISIIDAFAARGHECYVVGGAVRDFLLGECCDDFDLATSMPAHDAMQVLAEFGIEVIPTGIKHGTITAIADGTPYEITTFRVDGDYADNRHPDGVTFVSSIEEDLARRDFTINAMAYSPTRGTVDPYGGQNDLSERIIRCVGEAKERFGEDALRIIRALRFASKLGFAIEDSCSDAIHEMRKSLKSIAVERVSSELVKLLHGDFAGDVIRSYPDVITTIIPEMEPLIGLDLRNPLHVHDAWGHSVLALEVVKPKTTVMLMAALLHDIGKGPKACGHPDAKGKDHALISSEMACDILHRLKFPNASIKAICSIVRGHDIAFTPDPPNIKRGLRDFGRENYLAILDLKKADIIAHGPEAAEHAWRIDDIKDKTLGILRRMECYSVRDLAIDGYDAKAAGYEGRQIAEALERTLERVIDEQVENRKEDLLKVLADPCLLDDSHN